MREMGYEVFTKILRLVVLTIAHDAMLAKKLARKMNPTSFTIKLLDRYLIRHKIATMGERTVCATAKNK